MLNARVALLSLSSCLLAVTIAAGSQAFAQSSPRAEKKSFSSGFNLGYTVSSDLAQQRDPRLYTNRLATGISIGVLNPESGKERFNVSAGLMGQYKSVGAEVEAKTEVVELADIDLALGKSIEMGRALGAEHGLELGLGSSFPTSEDSQYEGYKAIPYASAKIASVLGPAVLSQTLSVSHVINSYDFSPVTKEINSDTSTSYSISLGAKFLKYFRASIGGSAKITHHLDDSNTMGFNNFQSLSASYGRWSAALKHTNGSHVMDKNIDLWFVDEYRRLVSFTLSCRF